MSAAQPKVVEIIMSIPGVSVEQALDAAQRIADPGEDRVARAELLLERAQASLSGSSAAAIATAALTQATLAGVEQTKRLADILDRVAWIPDSGVGQIHVSVQS